MGLVTDGRGCGYVQCFCGARGPAVKRGEFTMNGSFDLNAFDAATRRAWNTRAGSDGRAEIIAKLANLAERMKMHTVHGAEPPAGMFEEHEMWEGHLAKIQEKAPGSHMAIEDHPGGIMNLSRPQLAWTGSAPELMQVAQFAGNEMAAITDDRGGFELDYLRCHIGGFTSMEAAKAAAPEFARQVLRHLTALID